MPTYLRPGVFVEELTASANPFNSAARAGERAGSELPPRVTRSRWLAATSVPAILGFASHGPIGTPQLVTSWKQFVDCFGEYVPETYLALAVFGFFANGGQRCYVVRINGGYDNDGVYETAASARLSGADGGSPCLEVTARAVGPDGNRLSVDVRPAPSDNPDEFTLAVSRDDEIVELLDTLNLSGGPRFAPEFAFSVSRLIDVRVLSTASRPADGRVRLTGGSFMAPPMEVSSVLEDMDPTYGLDALERLPDIDTVCAPDLMAAFIQGSIDVDKLAALQQALIAHCEATLGRMAILDSPPNLTAQQVHEWRIQRGWDSPHAALYYPWIKVTDPVWGGQVAVPPSGHIAGIYARSALVKGIHCTVANEEIVGAVDTDYPLSLNEIDNLNPVGINAISQYDGSTATVVGGRTLTSDPAWRMLGTRRVADFFLRNVSTAMRWILYEPNNMRLWTRTVDELSGLCDLLLRAGVLSGDSPEDAYQIRCNELTNPPEMRDSKLVGVECDLFVTDDAMLSFRLVFASV